MKRRLGAVLLVITMTVFMLTGCGTEKTPKLEGSCVEIMEQVYGSAELEESFREAMAYYETNTVSDDMEEYVLGTDELDYIDSAYSAPLMSAQAYQCVIVRLEPDEDVLKAKQMLLDHADPRKWICVEAESVVVENVGDVILYVMADQATADALKTAFLALGETESAN